MNRINWRLYLGRFTLILACAFTSAWIRSLDTTDMAEFVKGSATKDVFYSLNGTLVWMNCHQQFANVETTFQGWSILSGSEYSFFTDADITWLWRWGGNGIGVQEKAADFSIHYFALHYATLVLPLVLLSVYLLRWKPRKQKVDVVVLEETLQPV